jgi:hypothetical protein
MFSLKAICILWRDSNPDGGCDVHCAMPPGQYLYNTRFYLDLHTILLGAYMKILLKILKIKKSIFAEAL